MSDSKTLWIIPEAPTAEGVSVRAARKRQGGLRVGVLDNSKSNADHLLRMIVDDIKAQIPVASVTALRKPSPAFGAESSLLDRLAQDADCVITAMAD